MAGSEVLRFCTTLLADVFGALGQKWIQISHLMSSNCSLLDFQARKSTVSHDIRKGSSVRLMPDLLLSLQCFCMSRSIRVIYRQVRGAFVPTTACFHNAGDGTYRGSHHIAATLSGIVLFRITYYSQSRWHVMELGQTRASRFRTS